MSHMRGPLHWLLPQVPINRQSSQALDEELETFAVNQALESMSDLGRRHRAANLLTWHTKQWHFCISCYLHSLKVNGNWRRRMHLSARTRGLRSNAEFQPCEPPIWQRFFFSNHCRYGHGQVTMLRPIRTCGLRLDLCSGMLSGQLACAWAQGLKVDDGNAYLFAYCQ